MKPWATQRAFTLIEMLVVIAIVGILTAISLPTIKNFRAGDTLLSGSRQLLDGVERARQLALSQRTTVYMVFCPSNFWSDGRFTSLPAAERAKGTNLFEKQLNAYALVTLRGVGDQPGQGVPRYLGPWRTLPEGTIIPHFKFVQGLVTEIEETVYQDPPAAPFTRIHKVEGFDYTDIVPFPSEQAYDPDQPNRRFVPLPYLAFNHLGQLDLNKTNEFFIPVAKGSVSYPRTGTGAPTVIENPPGNSTNAFLLVKIDRLTGRARALKQELP